MKAILQYSTDGTNYTDIGVLRLDEKDYKLTAVVETNEDGHAETIGYKIEARTILLEKDSSFLNQRDYYFRLLFDDGKVINLGQRRYFVNHDLKINKANIEEIEIVIPFFIEVTEYLNYITPTEA